MLVLALGPHRKRDVSPILYHDRTATVLSFGSPPSIQENRPYVSLFCFSLLRCLGRPRLCLQRRIPLNSELDLATMLMQFATALLLLPSSPTNSAQIGNIFYLVMLLFQERRSREDTGSIGRRALVDPFESPAMRVLVR